jgi:hypothetical protein
MAQASHPFWEPYVTDWHTLSAAPCLSTMQFIFQGDSEANLSMIEADIALYMVGEKMLPNVSF